MNIDKMKKGKQEKKRRNEEGVCVKEERNDILTRQKKNFFINLFKGEKDKKLRSRNKKRK